jgi:hypothetical protein
MDDYFIGEGAYYYNNLGFGFEENVIDESSIYVQVYKGWLCIPFIKAFCQEENIPAMYVPFFITVVDKQIPVELG